MSLGWVSLRFLLELGFGSLLTLLVIDRAAVGPRYLKFAGWVLLGLYGLALTLAWSALVADEALPAAIALGGSVVAAALLVVACASVSGWDLPRAELALLVAASLAGGIALALSVTLRAPDAAAATQGLTLASAFGSALVLGFTTWGMVLGHWYLVAPGLSIRHLARLVAPLPWILLGKAAVSGLGLWLLWSHVLGPGNQSLGDVMQRSPERVLDVVNVWARIPVGLLVPAVLAWMTRVTVRMERTQPATGILYAMCAIVYLGELMGKMVEGGTAVPL